MLLALTLLTFIGIAFTAWALPKLPSRTRWIVLPIVLAVLAGVVVRLLRLGETAENLSPITLLVLLCSLAGTGVAIWWFQRGRERDAVLLVLLAAFLLRADLAGRLWLYIWDERYHAVVAKNLLKHPLKPTLVEYPVKDDPPSRWIRTHVWLHKPPMTMWLMAGSMFAYGRNEIAMRVPSLVLGSLGVLVTFLLAKRFVGPRGGFFAAIFHAWHGRSADHTAGLRPSDHIDSNFIFLVGLGLLACVWAADALAERRRGAWWKTALAGVVLGLALLTKDAPALIVPVFLFLLLLARKGVRWRVRFAAPALVLIVGLLVWAPWQAYTAAVYPEAYAYKKGITARYFVNAVDGHDEVWYWHFRNIRQYFGILTPIPVAAFIAWGVWRRREWIPLIAVFLLTYGVFSAAAMKMTAYPFIVSPVIWCALGWATHLGLSPPAGAGRRLRWAGETAAVLLALTYFLSAARGDFDFREAKVRHPMWTRELRYMAAEIEKLPPGKWAVYNVGSPIEAMFYTDATCDQPLPTQEEVELADAKGFRIAVYGSPTEVELGALQGRNDVTFIPPDPRAKPMRELGRELQKRGLDRMAICNARGATDLREYLRRTVHVRVRSAMPGRDRWTRKHLDSRLTLVVLTGPNTPGLDKVRAMFPEAVFIPSPLCARYTAKRLDCRCAALRGRGAELEPVGAPGASCGRYGWEPALDCGGQVGRCPRLTVSK